MLVTSTIFKRSSVIGLLLFLGTFFTTGSLVVAQQQQMPQQQDLDVSEDELVAFAQAVDKVDSINQQANREMVEVIEENDLEVEQYNQIMRQLQSADDPSQLDSDEETVERAFEASNEIRDIQIEVEQKRNMVIQNEGLSPNRFDMILQLVKNDPQIRQQFEDIRQNE